MKMVCASCAKSKAECQCSWALTRSSPSFSISTVFDYCTSDSTIVCVNSSYLRCDTQHCKILHQLGTTSYQARTPKKGVRVAVKCTVSLDTAFPVCRRCTRITGVVTIGSMSGQSYVYQPDVGQTSGCNSVGAGVALSGHLRFRLDVGTGTGLSFWIYKVSTQLRALRQELKEKASDKVNFCPYVQVQEIIISAHESYVSLRQAVTQLVHCPRVVRWALLHFTAACLLTYFPVPLDASCCVLDIYWWSTPVWCHVTYAIGPFGLFYRWWHLILYKLCINWMNVQVISYGSSGMI